MSDYGIKISREGKNVLTANELELIVNSGKDSYKFLKKDRSTITTDGSGNSGLVSQNIRLPFPTVFDTFIKCTAVNPTNHTETVSNSYFKQTRELNLNAWQNDPEGGGGGDNGTLRSFFQGDTIFYSLGAAQASTTYEVTSVFFLPTLRAASEELSYFEDYGLKISKEGKDVFKAKPHEIFLSNSYVPARLVAEGILKLDLPDLVGSNTQQTVYADFNHELGFAPFFIGFTRSVNQDGNIWRPIPRPIFDGTTNDHGSIAEMFCTPTLIRASVWRMNVDPAPLPGGIDWEADTYYFHFFLFDIPLNVV